MIDLIQQQLDKVKREEQSLRERVFNDEIIDFEPSVDAWKNIPVGAIKFNRVQSPIETESQTNDYRLVEFKKENLDKMFSVSRVFPLENGDLLLAASSFESISSLIFTLVSGDDLQTVMSRKCFTNFALDLYTHCKTKIEI